MALIDALNARSTTARATLDREMRVLVGTECAACTAHSWPGRAVCSRCGGASMIEHRFSDQGTLTTHTEVWTPRPGLAAPYRLGEVALDGGVVVFCHIRGLDDSARVPLPVRLVISDDTGAVPAFWFEPVPEGGV